jgi:hypothetical protein
MRNSIRFRCLAFLFCGIALAAAYNKTRTEAMMLDTASRFLDSSGTQREWNLHISALTGRRF